MTTRSHGVVATSEALGVVPSGGSPQQADYDAVNVILKSTEAQTNDKSGVLDALSKAASGIRTKLGESLSTVQKYNIPLEQATTPSLEALQAHRSLSKAYPAGRLLPGPAFRPRCRPPRR